MLFTPNAQLQPSWRYPRGIDSRTRRGFKGTRPMPNIGYGSDKRTRHMLPSGFYKFVVHRPEDVDLLLMHNRTYAAEIANAVSTKKRKDIVQRARVLNVHVTNANARLKTAESE